MHATASERVGGGLRKGGCAPGSGAGVEVRQPPVVDGLLDDRATRARGVDDHVVPGVERHVEDRPGVGGVTPEDEVAGLQVGRRDRRRGLVLCDGVVRQGRPAGGPGAHGQARAVPGVGTVGGPDVRLAELLAGEGDGSGSAGGGRGCRCGGRSGGGRDGGEGRQRCGRRRDVRDRGQVGEVGRHGRRDRRRGAVRGDVESLVGLVGRVGLAGLAGSGGLLRGLGGDLGLRPGGGAGLEPGLAPGGERGADALQRRGAGDQGVALVGDQRGLARRGAGGGGGEVAGLLGVVRGGVGGEPVDHGGGALGGGAASGALGLAGALVERLGGHPQRAGAVDHGADAVGAGQRGQRGHRGGLLVAGQHGVGVGLPQVGGHVGGHVGEHLATVGGLVGLLGAPAGAVVGLRGAGGALGRLLDLEVGRGELGPHGREVHLRDVGLAGGGVDLGAAGDRDSCRVGLGSRHAEDAGQHGERDQGGGEATDRSAGAVHVRDSWLTTDTGALARWVPMRHSRHASAHESQKKHLHQESHLDAACRLANYNDVIHVVRVVGRHAVRARADRTGV
ncbi:hypothetical protein NOCARDAX2BIS_480072 [Nocardioides sp. AX2bis]|nr:hypothetical protein NOCARDAX2BIS_480072 [Nocardioides sp. AX2bis]